MKKLTILILIFFVTVSIFAEEPMGNKQETSGFAVEVGYGNAFAGLGIMGEYFIQSQGLIKGSVFVGLGYFPSIPIGIMETESSGGTVIGARAYVGNKHRLVLELTYGFIGVQAKGLYVNGTQVNYIQEDLIGPSGSVGYQYMNPSGYIFTFTVGSSSADTEYFGELSLLTLNLGAGYKF